MKRELTILVLPQARTEPWKSRSVFWPLNQIANELTESSMLIFKQLWLWSVLGCFGLDAALKVKSGIRISTDLKYILYTHFAV